MELIIEKIQVVLAPLMDAGPLVMIFVVFTLIGLIVKLGVMKAIRSGMMIAVGFSGVFIIVEYFLGQIGPAAFALGEKFGGVFTYSDVGWSAFASFAWGSPIAYAVVLISIVVNLLMIFMNMTDTLNLNIWDTWETTAGTLIFYFFTSNLVAALLFAGTCIWVNLMLSDFTAHKGHTKDFGFEGLSFYEGSNVFWSIPAHYIGKFLDKFKFTSNAKITPEFIQDKFGVIGEPAVLGGFIGLMMGLGAGYSVLNIITLMIGLSTAIILLPMMSGIVMQAIIPVSEAATKFMKEKTKGKKDLFIGVDPAIAVGNTTVLAVTVLMIPVLLILSFIIPGTLTMPLADLTGGMFIWIFAVAPNKFDLVRTFFTTIVFGICATIIGIFVAPWANAFAINQGLEVAEGTGVTSFMLNYVPEFFIGGLIGKNFESIGFSGVYLILLMVIAFTGFLRIRFLRNKAKIQNVSVNN